MGRELYELVETQLQIEPIGIVPLKADEGYLLLSNGQQTDTQVYNYQLTIFENATEKYRAIRTRYLRSYIRQFTNTYEAIKLDLIKDQSRPAQSCHFPRQKRIRFSIEGNFATHSKTLLGAVYQSVLNCLIYLFFFFRLS